MSIMDIKCEIVRREHENNKLLWLGTDEYLAKNRARLEAENKALNDLFWWIVDAEAEEENEK